MDEKIANLVVRLEQAKQATLLDLNSWPAERLPIKPAEGGWSALDVVDHLAKVEREFLAAMRQNLAGGGNRVGPQDRIKSLMVLFVMNSPIKVKTPPGAKGVQPEAAELSAVEKNWTETRRQMADTLETLTGEQLNVGLVQHPVGGWMTALGALRFLASHLRHHGYQLARLRG